jgi:hypothetical protein
MTSFEVLDFVDEKSEAGAEFMFRVSRELQRAFLSEKKSRKITQQAIAKKVGTSRAVINRQLHGLENLTARRIGELLWAMGWRPDFSAVKIPDSENEHRATTLEVGYLLEAANQNAPLILKTRTAATTG